MLEELQNRLDSAKSESSEVGRRARLGSWLRLGCFFAFLGCWLAAWGALDWAFAWASIAPALLFPVAVLFHERSLARQRALEIETDLLAEKIDRIRSVRHRPVHAHGRHPAALEPLDAGKRPLDGDEHRFELGDFIHKDVDLLEGSANLRDVLDRTQTPFGFRRLDYHLRHPIRQREAIDRRQDAARELLGDPELRWSAATAFHPLRERSLDFLTEFLEEPLTVAPTRALERVFLGFATLPPIALLAWAVGLVPGAIPSVAVTITFAVLMLNLKKVIAIRPKVYEIEILARAMERFCAEQMRRTPSSAMLAELRGEFEKGVTGALDGRWSTLCRRIGWLHWGDYGLVSLAWNSLTLWDLHFGARVERSLKGQRDTILRQASALGEWEVLASFAGLSEERGDYVFPDTIESDRPALEVEQGRHPYLAGTDVVANDLELSRGANMIVITGSNMAGKSTFLKMISLNVILAQLGAPVRADAMRLTPLRLFTVIDVEDDLVQGFSYFRVEVDRVKEVLAYAAEDGVVLGVFDEMFRGTNSTERVLAGREILRSLASTGGLFLMATHDMEYAKLPEDVDTVRNVHFAEDVSEKGVTFTYEMRPGPTRVRNALRVLEFCGIPADIIARARAGLSEGQVD